MVDLDQYSPAYFEQRVHYNVLSLTAGREPMRKPVAYLLGGQSGAGKTTLHKILKRETENKVLIVDGDAFRSQHPRAKELAQGYGKAAVSHTAAFAGEMVEALIEKLSDAHYSLVIEGTLRTVEAPLKTAHLLQKRGYQLEFVCIATKPVLSRLSILQRYEEMLR